MIALNDRIQARNGSVLDPMLSGCERSVLSYLMGGRQACEEFSYLSPDDFSLPTHRVTFGAIAEVFDEGEDPNHLVVTNKLRDLRKLDAVGGAGT